jgi:predicted tellurium resistance membrane protein TerC
MELFTFANLLTLLMLILLQAVLGFDNLLYISIESKRVTEDKQAYVRKLGIGMAIGLRLLLLFIVTRMIQSFSEPFLGLHLRSVIDGDFNIQSLITLAGGVFIIYTAVKEIFHMIALHDIGGHEEKSTRSVGKAVMWIVIMNLVFSFDSILSAMALTDNFYVMAAAIVVSGIAMIWLSDHVAEFLKKNRMYEILGLFVLFIVGVMLVSEGAHQAHLNLFNHEIHAMQKSTFYFVLAVLVIVDLVQGRYQKKILAERARGH